jgi:nucleotide-binding universal stress UspA family protein
MPKRILVAIDLSQPDTLGRVIAAGVEQVAAAGGELTVMTVVPDFVAGLDWRYAIRGETGGSEDFDLRAIVEETLARLNEVVAEHVPEGMKADTIVRHGTIYEQVLDVADAIGADQIVVGALRPQLSDYLLGPNTARIVRHAKCSVNVIRGWP